MESRTCALWYCFVSLWIHSAPNRHREMLHSYSFKEKKRCAVTIQITIKKAFYEGFIGRACALSVRLEGSVFILYGPVARSMRSDALIFFLVDPKEENEGILFSALMVYGERIREGGSVHCLIAETQLCGSYLAFRAGFVGSKSVASRRLGVWVILGFKVKLVVGC